MAVHIQGHAHIGGGGRLVLEIQTLPGTAWGMWRELRNAAAAASATECHAGADGRGLPGRDSERELAGARFERANAPGGAAAANAGHPQQGVWQCQLRAVDRWFELHLDVLAQRGEARARVVPPPDAALPADTDATAALQPPDDDLLVQIAEKDRCIAALTRDSLCVRRQNTTLSDDANALRAQLMVQADEKDRIIRDLTRDIGELTSDNDTLRDKANALRAQVLELAKAFPTSSNDDSVPEKTQ